MAGVTPGLRRLAWLIEVRGLANRSEGLGGPGPVDKSKGVAAVLVDTVMVLSLIHI